MLDGSPRHSQPGGASETEGEDLLAEEDPIQEGEAESDDSGVIDLDGPPSKRLRRLNKGMPAQLEEGKKSPPVRKNGGTSTDAFKQSPTPHTKPNLPALARRSYPVKGDHKYHHHYSPSYPQSSQYSKPHSRLSDKASQ